MASRRRGIGEGSLRERRPGLWEARLTLGYDARGRQVRRSLYGKTRAETAARMTTAQKAIADAHPPTSDRQTVASFLEAWWDGQTNLRPSTRRRYAGLIRSQLNPALGRVRLTHLTPQDVNRALRLLVDSGLAPRTANHARAVLRTALADAQRWGTVARNAASLAKPVDVPRQPKVAMRPEEARAILDAFRGTDLEAIVATALFTGMRQGEILGLRWSDVDLDRKVLHVRHALHKVPRPERTSSDLEFTLDEPKTHRSRRTVRMPDPLVAVLQQHRQSQRERRRGLGAVWSESIPDLVFTTPIGRPVESTGVTGRFVSRLRGAGLPRRRFHDLRHGAATLMLASGTELKVVSTVLGHSTIGITADTYADVLEELHNEAADRLGRLLGGES